MANDTEWYRYYGVSFKESKEEIYAREEKLRDLVNTIGKSKSTVLAMAVDEGIEVLLGDPERHSKLDQTQLAVIRMCEQLEQENLELQRHCKILGELGEEGYIEFCEDIGIDPTLYIERILQIPARKRSWSEVALQFLEHILKDGEEHSTAKIKTEAVQQGIINESSKDWDKIRTLASRHGFAKGKKGYWSC